VSRRPDLGLHAVGNAQFADDVFDVGLDGAFGNEQQRLDSDPTGENIQRDAVGGFQHESAMVRAQIGFALVIRLHVRLVHRTRV
jgi:hypothetical protein